MRPLSKYFLVHLFLFHFCCVKYRRHYDVRGFEIEFDESNSFYDMEGICYGSIRGWFGTKLWQLRSKIRLHRRRMGYLARDRYPKDDNIPF